MQLVSSEEFEAYAKKKGFDIYRETTQYDFKYDGHLFMTTKGGALAAHGVEGGEYRIFDKPMQTFDKRGRKFVTVLKTTGPS